MSLTLTRLWGRRSSRMYLAVHLGCTSNRGVTFNLEQDNWKLRISLSIEMIWCAALVAESRNRCCSKFGPRIGKSSHKVRSRIS